MPRFKLSEKYLIYTQEDDGEAEFYEVFTNKKEAIGMANWLISDYHPSERGGSFQVRVIELGDTVWEKVKK